ncbi:MAG: hypothetical protein KDD02_04725 [Phaeodactylibacter sp.]|nr:hypothetical protein [Phaeodactylibacter sp.]
MLDELQNLCCVWKCFARGQKQKYCSNKCKQKHHYYRVKEQTNTYHSQTIRALRRKLKLIELMGGKCSTCGYNKNVAALHFHHLDASGKEFKLGARILSNKRWEDILKEAQNCVLLCANCHAEAHNPELSIENVQKITDGASRRKRRDEKGVNSGKPSFSGQ